MNYKERQAFRKTNAWYKLKAKCRLHTSKDFITKEPLCNNWNLHHLDLDVNRYDNINDMNRFMPLNSKTHEVIHEIFKWYKKDHKVLDRIKKTLDLMEEYTYGWRNVHMDITKRISKEDANKIRQLVIHNPIKFIHKKTGNTYILLNDDLIECTNGNEDKKYCLYINLEGMVFVREHDEFYNKFTKL